MIRIAFGTNQEKRPFVIFCALIFFCLMNPQIANAKDYDWEFTLYGAQFSEMDGDDYSFTCENYERGVRLEGAWLGQSDAQYIFRLPPIFHTNNGYDSIYISLNSNNGFKVYAKIWEKDEFEFIKKVEGGGVGFELTNPNRYISMPKQDNLYSKFAIKIVPFKDSELGFVKLDVSFSSENLYLDEYQLVATASDSIEEFSQIMHNWETSRACNGISDNYIAKSLSIATSIASQLSSINSNLPGTLGILDALNSALDVIESFKGLLNILKEQMGWLEFWTDYGRNNAIGTIYPGDVEEVTIGISRDLNTLAHLFLDYGENGGLLEEEKSSLKTSIQTIIDDIGDAESKGTLIKNIREVIFNSGFAHRCAASDSKEERIATAAIQNCRPMLYSYVTDDSYGFNSDNSYLVKLKDSLNDIKDNLEGDSGAKASISDAWFSNETDKDGDGYVSSFHLNYRPAVEESEKPLLVNLKIYQMANTEDAWNLWSNSNLEISGSSTWVWDAGIGSNHNIYDWKIEIYREGRSTPDYIRSPSNDTDLKDFKMETLSQDEGTTPNLCYHSHTVDDNPSGGSSGNDDGQVNPGEDIELPVTLENTGNAEAHNVSAELSTFDSYVTITDSTVSSWRDIPAGTTKEECDFGFHVASNCPDGHTITFNLAISADEGNWSDTFSITVHSGSQTLSISGTVYMADGTTPFTQGGNVWACTGDPCILPVGFCSGDINGDGSYTIEGLPAGTYYLQAHSEGNYVNEWWADPSSVDDCSNAQIIAVTEKQELKDKDFQLDIGAIISGTVYESDGTTPVTKGWVRAYADDPCDYDAFTTTSIDGSGTYSFQRLPAGSYYLLTQVTGGFDEEAVYIEEWWAYPLSVIDCSSAQSIEVNAGAVITDRNFQLNFNLLYVSKTGHCGDKEPCYNSIQAALDAAVRGASIKIELGTYNESPIWDKWGTVSVSGGWNDNFSDQTGTTEMYAPSATGGGGVKVLPKVQVVPH